MNRRIVHGLGVLMLLLLPGEVGYQDLAALRAAIPENVLDTPLPSGARLIQIQNYKLVPGWSQESVSILFVAPPAFPGAQPDCFWVEPIGLRLRSGATPQASNDSNPIPEIGPRGTWFSWHLQEWNPNRDSLLTFFRVIESRLDPPR